MMSKEKQIEELSEFFYRVDRTTYRGGPIRVENYDALALALYDEGWRKQIEAEWLKDRTSKFEHRYNCSNCNYRRVGKPTPHCAGCGAKMKGVAE